MRLVGKERFCMAWLSFVRASSETRCGSFVDSVSVGHELVDSLSNLSLVGAEEIDLALDAELVACSDAWLSVLALAHEEGQLWVGTFDCLVVGADVRPEL